MRVCKDCLKDLPVTAEFWPTKHGQISGLVCRKCNSKRVAAYQKQKRLTDPDFAKKASEMSYAANKRRYAIDKEYRQVCNLATANYIKRRRALDPVQREKDAAACKVWAKNNAAKLVSKFMARRAAKSLRMPTWLTAEDKAIILHFYKLAKQVSEATGVKYEVDHIVPLQGMLVSGLHVPWNLQILSCSKNRSKGNKFDV